MQTRLLLLVMRPSFLSATATLAFSVGILAVTNWPYFTYNSALYPMLYGEFGIVTTLEQTPATAVNLARDLGENQILYAVIVGAVIALGGWAAFVFARAIHRGVITAEMFETSAEKISTLEHIAVRVLIAIMWFLFGFVTIGSLVPLGLLMSRIGAESILTLGGIALNVGALTLLATVFHCHVIFLRLFLLRPRVFGGRSEIESTMLETHDE